MKPFEHFGETLAVLIGQVAPSALPVLVDAALKKSGAGGLAAAVARLEESGFADRVRAWKAAPPELPPISSGELESALGRRHVDGLSGALGMSVPSLLDMLSQSLPAAVAEAARQAGAA